MKATKAAVIQAAPVFLNLNASIDKTEQLIKEAASNGANLVINRQKRRIVTEVNNSDSFEPIALNHEE